MLSGGMLIWAAFPNTRQSTMQEIQSSKISIPRRDQPSLGLGMENRQVVLEWPESMRIGDEDEIILTFEARNKSPVINPDLSTEDIYQRYNLMAEGKFEAAGIMVTPANPTRKSMPTGQAVGFTWRVSIDRAGNYNGKVWLSLRFLPLDGSQAVEVPVFVQELDIRATSLLGMRTETVRLLGGLGIILGLALSIDGMIKFVKRFAKMDKVNRTGAQVKG